MSGMIVSSTPDVSMDVSLNKTNSELDFTGKSDTAFGENFGEESEKTRGGEDIDQVAEDGGTTAEDGVTTAEDGVTTAENGVTVAEDPSSRKASGSKNTSHNNPKWLENMQQNFDQLIIQACSVATKAAVAANKNIEVFNNEHAMIES